VEIVKIDEETSVKAVEAMMIEGTREMKKLAVIEIGTSRTKIQLSRESIGKLITNNSKMRRTIAVTVRMMEEMKTEPTVREHVEDLTQRPVVEGSACSMSMTTNLRI